MAPTPKISPPRQPRAQATLVRVLEAAEAMLAEGLFEDMTMASLAERAGVAVGTIYTRFRTKEDLLPALFERHNHAVVERVATLQADLEQRTTMRERLTAVVRFAVQYHETHRGLLRALTHFVRAHPESASAQVMAERQDQYRGIATLVAGPRAGASRRARIEFALGVVNSVCRDQILFREVSVTGRERSARTLEGRLLSLLLPSVTSR